MIKLLEIYKELILEARNLTPRTLYKPTKEKDLSDRGQVLLKKINSGDPLRLTSGEDVIVDKEKSKNFITILKNSAYKDLLKIPFYDKDGNSYLLGRLEKTSDFGGQSVSRGVSIEDRNLKNLFLELEKINAPIDIKIGNTIYKNIVWGYKPKGNPKADFILYDDLDDDKIFISHKDYPNFQQYAGVNKLKNEFSEVQSFIDDVKEISKGQFKEKEGYERDIKDENLKIKSVYGYEESFGPNKVQIICIGDLKLKKLEGDNLYSLDAVEVFDYPKIPTGRYEPKLSASRREGHNQQGIKNCRLGIYPKFHFPTAKKI